MPRRTETFPAAAKANTVDSTKLKQNYDYDYPEGLDFTPGKGLHEHVKTKIMERVVASRRIMQSRFSSWETIDRTLTTYVDLTTEEEKIKKNEPRKAVSIVIPITYATKETLLTYRVAAFLDNPIFRYEGTRAEDIVGASLLEGVVNLHVNRFKVPLKLYSGWSDSFTYGFSATACIWNEKVARRTRMVQNEFFSPAIRDMMQMEAEYETSYEVVFEGNDLVNIDPYQFLPDPNVPVSEQHRAEYVGWIDRDSYVSLLKREGSEGGVFNVRYLSHTRNNISQYYYTSTGRDDKTGAYRSNYTKSEMQPVDIIYMYVDLIPSEWHLGSSDYPEKWFFGLAGDNIIVIAEPMGLDHDEFPVVIDCPAYDGRSMVPIAELETINGLQHTIDWLFQSHITNIRKAINDMIVIDPYLVNYTDVANPKPGKIIRMRRAAFGRGLVRDAIQQLNVNDVTRTHVNDAAVMMQIADSVTSTGEPVRGVRRKTSERVSAAEITDTKMAALSRLEKNSRISSIQCMSTIGDLFAHHTKQLMSQDMYVKNIGRLEKDLMLEYDLDEYSLVRPSDIDVYHDVIPHDGTTPGAQDTQAWTQLYQIIANNHVLAQQFDMVRLFKHIARGMGARNVNDFVLNTSGIDVAVASQERVEEEARKGNIAETSEVYPNATVYG